MTTRRHDFIDPSPSADTLRPHASAVQRLERAQRPPRRRSAAARGARRSSARGVGALHARGKVHRDIKPSNVLVDADGARGAARLRAGAVDGARRRERRPRRRHRRLHGARAGAGRKVGPAADWYSVGVVLYEALTGGCRSPGAPLEVLLQKQGREPPPPRALAPAVPADLDALCVGLLRRDPRERPARAELVERLVRGGAATALASRGAARGALRRRARASWPRSTRPASATRAGAPVTVHVRGESGVGKSALVRHFVDELRAASRRRWSCCGRCYERESVPYKAVDGVIDALSRCLARCRRPRRRRCCRRAPALLAEVFPVLRRVEAVAQAPRPAERRAIRRSCARALFAALRELLARLASTRAARRRHRRPAVGRRRQPGAARASHAPARRAARCCCWRRCARAGEDAPARAARALMAARGARGARCRACRPTRRARSPPSSCRDARRAGARPSCRRRRSPTRRAAIRCSSTSWCATRAAHRPIAARRCTSTTRCGRACARLDADAQRVLELVAVAGGPLVQEAAARAADVDFATFGAARGDAARGEPRAHHRRARRATRSSPITIACARRSSRIAPPAEVRRAHERLALALEATGRADPEALAVHWRGAGDNDKAAALRDAGGGARVQGARVRSRRAALSADAGAASARRAPSGDAAGARSATRWPTPAAAPRRRAPICRRPTLGADRRARAAPPRRRAAPAHRPHRRGLAGAGAGARPRSSCACPSRRARALVSLLWRRARLRLRGLEFRERAGPSWRRRCWRASTLLVGGRRPRHRRHHPRRRLPGAPSACSRSTPASRIASRARWRSKRA